MSRASRDAGDAVDGFDGRERRGLTVESAVERRQHERYAVDAMAEVLVSDGSLLFRGRVLNLSAAGCYVETEARLRMRQGTPVEMVFRVKDAVFRVEATSRMARSGKGAGFRFSDLSPRMREELEALLAELSLRA